VSGKIACALDPGSALRNLPPFPIVLVTTRTNIITIGQIHYFSFAPLQIGIAVAYARHTHGLIEDEGEFAVNVPDEGLLEAVRICGRCSGRDTDKFAAAGLTREPCTAIAATGIAECGARLECRVAQRLEFADRAWFIGPVVAVSAAADHIGRQALQCDRLGYANAPQEIGTR
jgi:flavin reductase (DIM6/NTAB) family NADH-FMN oxidoreductase RutF